MRRFVVRVIQEIQFFSFVSSVFIGEILMIIVCRKAHEEESLN